MRQARKDEKKAVMVKDNLYVDGKEVLNGKKGSSDGKKGDEMNGAAGGATVGATGGAIEGATGGEAK